MFKKANFPNYLNSPPILLFWETDELKFIGAIVVFLFAFLFLANAPTLVIVFSILYVVPVAHEGYRRLTKDVAPNWYEHFMYSKGLSPGINKMFLVKNGIPVDSDIIPPSFITIFED
jgi:type IV conjugative transfer system protein TraL